MYLLENVGKSVDINFVMKELTADKLTADKQFTIWWINLDQQDPQ
jgi:hypothetical protein